MGIALTDGLYQALNLMPLWKVSSSLLLGVVVMKDKSIFYITAITIVHAGEINGYYVHTNAGTSFYLGFDRLPVLAVRFLDDNLMYAKQICTDCTIVPCGSAIYG